MAGMTVLVAGGAGAVGNAAIQLARWSGATVVTTVSSPEKAALATAAGAHHVVNYREGDTEAAILAVAPDGVDLVVEVAPAQNNELDVAVTKVHGTVAIYANNGGDEFTVPLRPTFSKNLRYQFLILYTLDERFRAGGGRGRLRGGPRRARCGSARTPACRCTTSRWTRPRRRTTPSSRARSARCFSTLPPDTAHWSP